MFLATTALSRYWEKNRSIILLGEWCLNNSVKENLKKKYKIIPYHWNKFDKIEKDNKYYYSIYKLLIPLIAKQLNHLHNKNYSDRYWEILIGVWLIKFIDLSYDRFRQLKKANNLKIKLETLVLRNNYAPQTLQDFYKLGQNDYYNLYIFSKILIHSKFKIKLKNIIINDNKLNNIISDSYIEKKNYIPFNKKIFKKLSQIRTSLSLIFRLDLIKRIIGQKYNYVWDLGLPIQFNDKKLLFKKLNLTFFTNNYFPSYLKNLPKVSYNKKMRNIKIQQKNINDDYFQVLIKIIFLCMPKEYLENYQFTHSYLKRYLPPNIPKITLTRSPYEYGSGLRHITALLSEHGSKLISCQEGGGLAVRKYNSIDVKLLFSGCDKFLTWGWKANNKKIIPFYNTKTFWIKKYHYKEKGHILLVGQSCRRYHYSLFEGNLISQNLNHVKMNIDLLSKLNSDLLDRVIYRFHNQHGFKEYEKIKEKFPNLNTSFREEVGDFYNLLYGSSLVICTSDYTSNLQPLMLNHPTVWLWDKKMFPIRNSAKKYYDILNKIGILHYDPSSCANKIESIKNNPLKWWKNKELQRGIDLFKNQYCRHSIDIATELKKIVLKETKTKY